MASPKKFRKFAVSIERLPFHFVTPLFHPRSVFLNIDYNETVQKPTFGFQRFHFSVGPAKEGKEERKDGDGGDQVEEEVDPGEGR